MSYIIDALKRAEAERGHVTGAAQAHDPVPPRTPGGRDGGRSFKAGWWIASVVALVCLVGWLTWEAFSGTGHTEAADTPPAAEAPQETPKTPSSPPTPAGGQREAVIAAAALAANTPPTAPAPAPILLPQREPRSTTPLVAAAAETATPSGATAPPPTLQVSGVTYSDNPAHRMLIINGKVVLEGQDIEAGLRLEAITPRSAVVNHGGKRFNINY